MYGRILALILAGILPFLFVDFVFGASPGDIYYYDFYSSNETREPNPSNNVIIKLNKVDDGGFNHSIIPIYKSNILSKDIIGILYICSKQVEGGYEMFAFNPFYIGNFSTGAMSSVSLSVFSQLKSYPSWSDNLVCGPHNDICKNNDSDGDGICDSCDKRPGDYDPRDCVTSRSYDSATNKIIGMSIDEGCTGKNDKYYQSKDPIVGTPFIELATSGNHLYKISPPNCNGSDVNGQCSCAYKNGSDYISDKLPPPDNFESFPALPNTADPNRPDPQLDPTNPVADPTPPPASSNPDESIKNDPTPDTGTSIEEKNAENIADIEEAIRQTNYEIQKLSKALEDKQLSQIERQDIMAQIARNIETLQRNQNKLAEATNEKIKITNNNLDKINNNLLDGTSTIDKQGEAIQGKLEGIKDGIGDIGGKVDGIGNTLEGMKDGISEGTGKLDDIGKSLKDIEDKLDDGIKPEGDAPLPGDNIYDPKFDSDLEEDSFADNVKNFINSGLPFSNVFKGTKIKSSSSNSKISFDAYGKTVTIDFSKYESIYDFMGRVLLFCCLVLSLMIIVGRIK